MSAGRKMFQVSAQIYKRLQQSLANKKARLAERAKEIQALKINVRDLTKSRDHWRKECLEFRRKHKTPSAQASASAQADAASDSPPESCQKNDSSAQWMEFEVIDSPVERPRDHLFQLHTIDTARRLILEANLPAKTAETVFDIFADRYPDVERPSHFSMRTWVERIGLYFLNAIPKRLILW